MTDVSNGRKKKWKPNISGKLNEANLYTLQIVTMEEEFGYQILVVN